MISRRRFLQTLGGVFGLAALGGGYAFGVEPALRLRVQRWRIEPPGWRGGPLRIAALADPHVGEPHMSLSRLRRIVQKTNALDPDLTVLLGDYVASHPFQTRKLDVTGAATVLSDLSAPLGVHAILGNHDWWDDTREQRERSGRILSHDAFAKAGLPVLDNRAVRIDRDTGPFWLAGLGDQLAYVDIWDTVNKRVLPAGGVDDLPGTLGQVTDDAPVILLAHEPDIFPDVPDRVALTLSGHTHGGQVRLVGWAPVVPSRFGNRYAYGHVREGARDIVISGGLGCSVAPLRFGIPPEITLIEVS
ncbi:MAG: metallophosphoesterase [Pseudomonadota bacterium]